MTEQGAQFYKGTLLKNVTWLAFFPSADIPKDSNSWDEHIDKWVLKISHKRWNNSCVNHSLQPFRVSIAQVAKGPASIG